MKEKKTTLGLLNSTLHIFNCEKVLNKFVSADDFLLFLLDIFAKTPKQKILNKCEAKKENE